jgi:class 3 adenylate cyclase
MAEGTMLRWLAAVIAADVADYAALMNVDEDATLRIWRSCQREVIEPRIAAHRGRLVKTTGDGFLAEFVSAQDAVRSAIDMQREFNWRRDTLPDGRRFGFRMGVNLGDILSDDEDIYGDGVNIAARIKGMAQVGEALVSGSVHDQIRAKPEFACESLGGRQFKNISDLVQVWRVVEASEGFPRPPPLRRRLPTQGKPSRPSPCCRSTICRAIRSRSFSPTA